MRGEPLQSDQFVHGLQYVHMYDIVGVVSDVNFCDAHIEATFCQFQWFRSPMSRSDGLDCPKTGDFDFCVPPTLTDHVLSALHVCTTGLVW